MSDLKSMLAFQKKKPFLHLSDINTVNNIKMLMLELTLTLGYQMKVIADV